ACYSTHPRSPKDEKGSSQSELTNVVPLRSPRRSVEEALRTAATIFLSSFFAKASKDILR
ncbi:MAG: hypothetical protein NUV82_02445, partial [Candidatus Komeilibacteria bacterium]|nr:hypothetical protein [Candidatus Komeilibacteria bacterium]